MKNEYDNYKLDIINLLKTNITHIFHIRKFRNEIKNRISNTEFLLNTNRFEARFRVLTKPDEKELIPYLDIENKKAALEKNSYHCTIILDEYFPEMVTFWTSVFNIIQKDP